MSILLHYSSSIVKYCVRLFNLVNRKSILSVENETRLVIKHHVKDLKKPELLISLQSQLKKAFSRITEKYLTKSRRGQYLNVQMSADDSHLLIIVDGLHLVPTSKIIKLLDLILWYSLTARTGIRPKDDPVGSKITDEWNAAIKVLKSKFARAKRRYDFTYEPLKCTTCAKATKTLVKMQVQIGQELIEHQIPVCDKHKMNSI
ncbi:MAG: hypothetical protein D6732_27005 [Methanobacteriota archaeon]|nr:MAG: hypothetical protein D6732_27005 [Euryarchaeota archaeon]